MFKILVVDDEPHIRKGIRVIIQRGQGPDVQVIEAENGEEAKVIILESSPQVVITDIKMPILDGLELIEHIHCYLVNPPIFIVLSGYDEFKYAKKAMKYGVREYLLKPVQREELNLVLSKCINSIKEKELSYGQSRLKYIQNKEGMKVVKEKNFNLLLHSDNKDEKLKIVDDMKRLGIVINKGKSNIMVIDYRSYSGKTKDEIDKVDHFAIKNIIKEILKNHKYEYVDFYDSDGRLVIILWNMGTDIDKKEICLLNNELAICLDKFLHMEIYTGCVLGVKDIVEINTAYNKAIENVRNKLVDKVSNISFDFENRVPSVCLNQVMKVESNIKRNLEFSNIYEVNKLLETSFSYLLSENARVSSYQMLYNKLHNEIISYFDEKGIGIFDDLEINSLIKDFELFWTLEQLENHIKMTYFKMDKCIQRKRDQMTNVKMIDQIIEYLDRNYEKNINLNIVAAEFDKTSSYISVLFKRETGKNFLSYLTDLRMSKAKKLLESSHLKINDIALRVGYINPKHFNVVFKKNTGLSPKSYRNKSF